VPVTHYVVARLPSLGGTVVRRRRLSDSKPSSGALWADRRRLESYRQKLAGRVKVPAHPAEVRWDEKVDPRSRMALSYR
jgi:hypothetical protein